MLGMLSFGGRWGRGRCRRRMLHLVKAGIRGATKGQQDLPLYRLLHGLLQGLLQGQLGKS